MPTIEERADAYLAAWNDVDHVERATLLNVAIVDDVVFADPLARLSGRDGLIALMHEVRADYPGCRFERSSAIDRHDGAARYAWTMYDEHGAAYLTGIDVVQLADDGRFSSILGFFGELATMEKAS